MKTLLLILFPLSLQAQSILGYKITDKDMHDQAGMIISGWASSSVYYWELRPWLSMGAGIGAAGTIGVGKEVIWDNWLGKGTPDPHDAGSTIFGGMRMSIISRIGFDYYEKKVFKIDSLMFQFDSLNVNKNLEIK